MCSVQVRSKEEPRTQFGQLPEDFWEEMLQLGLIGMNRSFAVKGEEREDLRADGYTEA